MNFTDELVNGILLSVYIETTLNIMIEQYEKHASKENDSQELASEDISSSISSLNSNQYVKNAVDVYEEYKLTDETL